MRRLVFPLVLCAMMLLAGSPATAAEVSPAELSNRRCASCHAQPHTATLTAEQRKVMVGPTTRPGLAPVAPGPRPEIYVNQETLARSVHGKLACTSCHADAIQLPHPARMAPPSCDSGCHTSATSGHLQGAHADALAKGNPLAPQCSTCHGGHDITARSNRQSPIHPLNIAKLCGDCHSTHTTDDGRDANRVGLYLDSVHGRALQRGGMAVSATCVSCHGSHKVLPSAHPESSVNRHHVAATCGTCHVGVSEAFAGSVHATEVARGRNQAPTCADCHTAHAITRTDTPAFKLDIVSECGTCHDQPLKNGSPRYTLYQSYRDSYHGQVTMLGYERAARCSDCHGAHNVRRIDDPASALHEGHRVEVCRKCHPGANESFATYQAHADPTSFQRSAVLYGVRWYFILMMSGAFGFFGLHSVLWFIRTQVERWRHPHPAHGRSGPMVRRFSRVDRVNHAFVIISFFGLTLTGLPLLYADEQWGRTLAAMLGGPKSAGLLHRFFAIILGINLLVHVISLAHSWFKIGTRKMLTGHLTLMPRWKDVSDCVGMWKWFFGLGRKPRFDRWTYWEKFDYIAEVGGTVIIGVSGLMLWFPVFFSHFIPGWGFNVAQFVHGYEALLAIGFIFTIHFFNAHLRPEKFPVDDVMFTGSMPEAEFKEERPEEYDRLVAEGKLEALRVPPPQRSRRIFAVCMGITAMAVGTTLVVLIILAGLGWM